MSVELTRAGLAYHFKKYSPDAPKIAKAEAEAKNAKRGVWSGVAVVEPWVWRSRK